MLKFAAKFISLQYELINNLDKFGMGGVPVKHHTKSKVGRRRSHLALKPRQIFACLNCHYPILSHRICINCGYYKGKVVKEPKLKIKK